MDSMLTRVEHECYREGLLISTRQRMPFELNMTARQTVATMLQSAQRLEQKIFVAPFQFSLVLA
jgi:hypothetical protein